MGRIRRRNIVILAETLDAQPADRMRLDALAEELEWSEEKVRRVVAEHGEDNFVAIGKGSVVTYQGAENAADSGVYLAVAKVLGRGFATKEKLREVTVHITAKSGHRGSGGWSHPDLVLECFPPRRRTRESWSDLHSFEVEAGDGFTIGSVYQAHAQGIGATFSWVLLTIQAAATKAPEYRRALRVAEELGIGVIVYSNPAAFSSWRTIIEPKRRSVLSEDRAQFVEQAMPTGFEDVHGPA